MRAGKLKTKILIERITETANQFGEPIKSWTTFVTAWAEIRPLIGREFFASKQIDSEITAEIRIRYIAGITTKMRVNNSGQLFNVKSVINPQNARKELVLKVVENEIVEGSGGVPAENFITDHNQQKITDHNTAGIY